jgi:glyoxylase-like metal-dependent hydrolase (beta-lactamase superfamily II)
MPTRTYTSVMRLGSGDERIDLRYFGRAHTNGDTFVVFPALGIMHAADVFPNKGVPGADSNNGGSGVEYSATLRKAADFAAKNKIATIINGHNDTPSTVADMREYSRFVADYVAYAFDL